MARRGVVLAAWIGTLALLCVNGQENETCTTDSCGVESCDPGYELEVSLSGGSLMIICDPCEIDHFKAESGSEACTMCPDGLVSNGTASECSLEEGFWRLDDSSLTAYECPNADACIGGSDSTSYCADGFKGPLCAVCTNDYYPSGSYECLECSEGNAASALLTIIFFLAALTLFLVVVLKAAETVEEAARETEDAANESAAQNAVAVGMGSKLVAFFKKWKDTLIVRFKIIVAHFQIVTTFPAVLDVQWPEAFNRYADKVSVVTLNFWGILSQSCFFRPDYLKQLVFTTLLPLSIVGVLIVYYAKTIKKVGSNPVKRRAAWDRTAGGILLTGFFFYIVTSTLILQAFDCQDFEDGSSYMKADYRISCDSDKYNFIYGYAIAMAIVFPAGIPLTYLIVLHLGKERINPEPQDPGLSYEKRELDPTIQKTKFLWGTYRPHVYFYEVWECIRKLLLTGLLVYFEEGTSTQVVIAMLITLAGLRVLAGLRPYRQKDENNLAEASLWVTFLTLFAGLLIKSQVAEEDGYDTVALGIILSFMNAALLGLAAFQLLWTTSEYVKEKWDDTMGARFEPKRKEVRRSWNRPQDADRPLRSPTTNYNQNQNRQNNQHNQNKARAPVASPVSGGGEAYQARGRSAVRPTMASPDAPTSLRSPVPVKQQQLVTQQQLITQQQNRSSANANKPRATSRV